jgi:serine/threonine protein kinase
MRGTTTGHLRNTEGGRGKPGYRAPELLREDESAYNKQVDIWSLGCILYELCTGEKAFKSDWDGYEFALLRKSGENVLPALFSEHSDQIVSIFLQMLEFDYRRRPCESKILYFY